MLPWCVGWLHCSAYNRDACLVPYWNELASASLLTVFLFSPLYMSHTMCKAVRTLKEPTAVSYGINLALQWNLLLFYSFTCLTLYFTE